MCMYLCIHVVRVFVSVNLYGANCVYRSIFFFFYKTPFNLSSELLVSVHFEFSAVLKITAGCMSPVICLIIVSILGKLIQPSYFFCYYFHLAFLVRSRWVHLWFCHSDCLPEKMLHITGEYIDGDRMIK